MGYRFRDWCARFRFHPRLWGFEIDQELVRTGLVSKCARIIVSQIVGTTGAVVFGTVAVVAATLVGAIKQFAPAAASGVIDTYTHADNANEGNPLKVDDYALDVAVNGEGLIVSIVVR